MSYTYPEVDRGSLDYEIVSHAERVLRAAIRALDLPGLWIRWYVRQGADLAYRPAGRGALDKADERHLTGWYGHHCVACDGWIAVRADRPLREIGLTVGHEAYHRHQDRHGQPLNEAAAEHFAQRLLDQLGAPA